MKLAWVRGECPDRVSCPNVYVTDRGTHVVQGDRRGDLVGELGRAEVEVPFSLLPEADGLGHPDVRVTDRGTVLVRGRRVIDQEALATLRLPAGEDAVELDAAVLPSLVVAG